MKKLIALSLAVLCLALAACSSAQALVMHETLPWTVDGGTLKEESTYRITRYLGNCDDLEKLPDNAADKPLVITHDASYMTYTLYEGWGVKIENEKITPFKDDTTRGLTLLTMTLKVYYLNEDYVPERYRINSENNIPETIISCAVFDRYNLSAQFTYREINLTQIKGENLNHKMWVDYTGGVLGKKIAKIQYAPYDANSIITESSIKSGEHFDNESLYYYMRALKSTDGGADSSLTFNFSLPYENLLNGKKIKPRSLIAATVKDDIALSTNILSEQEFNALYDLFNLDSMPVEQKNNPDDEQAKYKICSYTTLRLDEKKSGPIIKLYYSRYPVRENRAKNLQPLSKLLMQVKTYTYGFTADENGSSYFNTSNPQYSQIFQLLNYSQRADDPPQFINI